MILITEEETAQTGFSEDEMRLEIALMLFEKQRFTLGQASRFARLHRTHFQQELVEFHGLAWLLLPTEHCLKKYRNW